MKGAVLYGPYDVRCVEREDPKIVEPTDVILRLSASCVSRADGKRTAVSKAATENRP